MGQKGRAKHKSGQKSDEKKHDSRQLDLLLIGAIIAIALLARLVTLADVGITYDEPIYVMSGIKYVEGASHLDFSDKFWAFNTEHPPVSKYVYGLFNKLLNGGAFDYNAYYDAKLASALLGAGTCIVVFLIGRDFFSREVGVVSALILALIPTFLAHTQIAAIEAPLAFFFTLTAYLFMVALKRGSLSWFLASAAAFGLTLGTKYNGVFVLPVLGLLYLLYQLGKIRAAEGGKLTPAAAGKHLKELLLPAGTVLGLCVIGLLVLVVTWPWLWSDPVARLVESVTVWSASPEEYFLGVKQAAPIYYYPVYFLVTTPALLLIPLTLGIIGVLGSKDAFKYGILLWLIVPFAYGLTHFVRDGMRYLIFIYPAVALLCGYGLARAAAWIDERYHPGMERLFLSASAIVVLYLIVTAVTIAPFYLDYYNVLAGGPANVQKNHLFEFGWWGEGIQQAMEYVEQTAPPQSVVYMMTVPDDETNTMFLEGRMTYAYAYLDKAGIRDQTYDFAGPAGAVRRGQVYEVVPDYVILNDKAMRDLNVTVDSPSFRPVHNVTVQGATLVTVYGRA